ncbi:hypothetical protein NL676_023574 [Syzygium grande]|nr:hypothetical protein NL676_023574 [Syzygium grande]
MQRPPPKQTPLPLSLPFLLVVGLPVAVAGTPTARLGKCASRLPGQGASPCHHAASPRYDRARHAKPTRQSSPNTVSNWPLSPVLSSTASSIAVLKPHGLFLTDNISLRPRAHAGAYSHSLFLLTPYFYRPQEIAQSES